MGFPVVTVTETEDGITVRQDRFLETGPARPEHNETVWYVVLSGILCGLLMCLRRTIPLSLLTVSEDGKAVVDTKIVLDTREKTIPVDIGKPYKLNAGTVGVCEFCIHVLTTTDISINQTVCCTLMTVC